MFTKGEWISYIGKDGSTRHILADRKDGKPPTPICRLVDGTQDDALLLRSAPELYEACKELIRRDEIGSIRLPTQAAQILKQALAKVKGD